MEQIPNLGLVQNVSSSAQPEEQLEELKHYQTYQATGTEGGFVGQELHNRGLSEVARDSEQKMIITTLGRLNGSRKDAALELGISPRTLRYKLAKMKDLGMAIPS
jgi:two-component system response regulator FlrC